MGGLGQIEDQTTCHVWVGVRLCLLLTYHYGIKSELHLLQREPLHYGWSELKSKLPAQSDPCDLSVLKLHTRRTLFAHLLTDFGTAIWTQIVNPATRNKFKYKELCVYEPSSCDPYHTEKQYKSISTSMDFHSTAVGGEHGVWNEDFQPLLNIFHKLGANREEACWFKSVQVCRFPLCLELPHWGKEL